MFEKVEDTTALGAKEDIGATRRVTEFHRGVQTFAQEVDGIDRDHVGDDGEALGSNVCDEFIDHDRILTV